MITTTQNDFDEARITEAAEHVRKKLDAMFNIESPLRLDLIRDATHRAAVVSAAVLLNDVSV